MRILCLVALLVCGSADAAAPIKRFWVNARVARGPVDIITSVIITKHPDNRALIFGHCDEESSGKELDGDHTYAYHTQRFRRVLPGAHVFWVILQRGEKRYVQRISVEIY